MSAYYASPTGSDSNPGTLAAPKRSPGAALALASPGDTVYFRGGTYSAATDRIDSDLHSISNGTAGNRITCQAYQGELVTIKPTIIGSPSSRALYLGSKSYLTFKEITFDASSIQLNTGSCVKCDNTSSYLKFIDCAVTGGGSYGQGVPGPSGNGYLFTEGGGFHEILGGSIHHNGTSTGYDHGLYIGVPDVIVDGVDIHHNTAYGIHPWGGDQSRLIVRNCKVHHNSIGIGVYSNPDIQIYNNVCWANVNGIVMRYGATNTKVYHNTCSRNTEYGIENDSNSTTTDLRNNVLWGNGIRDLHVNQSPTYIQLTKNVIGSYYYSGGSLPAGNLAVDPLFTDSDNYDFSIVVGSPAAKAGAFLSGYSTDHNGAEWQDQARPEIGAYAILQQLVPWLNTTQRPEDWWATLLSRPAGEDAANMDLSIINNNQLRLLVSQPGKVVTGPEKLAQRFLVTLLTPTNSIAYRSNRGTSLQTAMVSRNVLSEFDLLGAFNRALSEAESILVSDESDDLPDDERFASATVTKLTVNRDTTQAEVLIRSVAGTSAGLTIPLTFDGSVVD